VETVSDPTTAVVAARTHPTPGRLWTYVGGTGGSVARVWCSAASGDGRAGLALESYIRADRAGRKEHGRYMR